MHFISWSTFISYEILVAGVLYERFSNFWDYALHYTINIGLFYLHASVVLPYALQRRRTTCYWLIPLLLTGEIFAFIAITYWAEYLATMYFGVQLTRSLVLDYEYGFRSLWRALYFMGFATGSYFLHNFLKERLRADNVEKQRLLDIIENQQLQNELVRSQNAFLKAQINPHFLFNTLSFVYNRVRKTSGEAAEAILSLSQMMRYALQSDDEFYESDLLEEIEHVEHLLLIHQLRHEHQLQVQLACGSNLSGIKFIPLVLITLVENMLKHGDLSQKEHPARIDIHFEDNILFIGTSNLKLSERPSGHRIGLDNIKKRLHHTYGKNVSFSALTDEQGYFRVELHILPPQNFSQPVYEQPASLSL